MAYTPNPVDATQPTEDKFVESAAAEFRALKGHVNDEIERLEVEIGNLAPGGAISSDAQADLFTCDGVQTVFTLFRDPGRLANLDVSIGGVTQRPFVDYQWVSPGRTLTFTVPPVAGDQNLLVRYTEGLPADTTGTLRDDLANTTELNLGDALIGVKQPFTGSVGRTQHQKNADFLSVKDFGALGDGVTNDTAAFLACKAACVAAKATMRIPGGTYLLTAGTNLGATDLAIVGDWKTILQYTGAGDAFVCDAGGNGEHFDNMIISQLSIKGNPATTNIFRLRGFARGSVSNIEVAEGAGCGFSIEFAVSVLFRDCKITGNGPAPVTRPANNWKLTDDGTPGGGYYVANCTFVNCIGEANAGSRGLLLENGQGNLFIGGTFESVGIGIDIAHDRCISNVFRNVWCEANTIQDIRVKGSGNEFHGMTLISSNGVANIGISTGTATLISGGFVRWVDLQSTSSDTLLLGAGLSDNPALGITGIGTHKRIGCVLYDIARVITGRLEDILGSRGSFVPQVRQNAAVLAVSAAAGTYDRVGRLANIRGMLTLNAAGTPGLEIIFDLPAGLALHSDQLGLPVGTGGIRVAGVYYVGTVVAATSTSMVFQTSGVATLLGITPAITLAVGSTVYFGISATLS